MDKRKIVLMGYTAGKMHVNRDRIHDRHSVRENGIKCMIV